MNKSTRTADCAYGRLRQRLRVGQLTDRELSDLYFDFAQYKSKLVNGGTFFLGDRLSDR